MTLELDVIRDAALFRLWCRLAETAPSKVARALACRLTVDDYRTALKELARSERINLP